MPEILQNVYPGKAEPSVHTSALARRASDHLPVILRVAWEATEEAAAEEAGAEAGLAAKS